MLRPECPTARPRRWPPAVETPDGTLPHGAADPSGLDPMGLSFVRLRGPLTEPVSGLRTSPNSNLTAGRTLLDPCRTDPEGLLEFARQFIPRLETRPMSSVRPPHALRAPRSVRWRLAGGLALAGAIAAAPCAAAENRLPDLGDAAGETLDRAEEEKLGQAFLRQIRRRLSLVDDPEVNDYIDALGQRIARADPERRYRFLVVDAPTVNAFAGPGGVIAVNAGLVVVTESESELAAVLAHEIAHVTQRHLAQLIERSGLASLATLASVFASIVIATQNPQAGQAAIAATAAGAQQSALRFSREKEMEADRAGMALLHQAGFDPRAVPTFFERFQDWQRFSSTPPEFLSSHPVTLSRIADTRGRAEQFEPRTYRESADYPLIRAKMQVRLATKPGALIDHFRARVSAAGRKAAEADRYGLALALMSASRNEEASVILEELRRDFPNRAAHRAAGAQSYSALGESDRALELLAASLEWFPDYRSLVYGYGRELVRVGRPDEAADLLRRFQRIRESDPAVYRLLGLAYQRAGRRAASHVALAEFHYRNGDLESAIRQLEIALDDPAIDDYNAARAQARREQILEERPGRR